MLSNSNILSILTGNNVDRSVSIRPGTSLHASYSVKCLPAHDHGLTRSKKLREPSITIIIIRSCKLMKPIHSSIFSCYEPIFTGCQEHTT